MFSKMENEQRIRAMMMCRGLALPMALKAALELKVPDILAQQEHESPMLATEIASHILKLSGSNSDAKKSGAYLERVLRVLAASDVVTESYNSVTHERRFKLTLLGKYFVDNGNDESLAPMAMLSSSKVFSSAWQYLHEPILDNTCEPFVKAHGKTEFEKAKEDETLNTMFNSAMANYTRMVMRLLLSQYDKFSDIHTLVDVGGGVGVSLSLIIEKHPHIRGINFDQPHVVATAPSYPGVEHVGGDMFEAVPSGDAIFLKWMLHDWDDERCMNLLRICRNALPTKGKMIVCEAVLPESASYENVRNVSVLYGDLTMLAINSGGRERSYEEFRDIALAAGFERIEVILEIDTFTIFEFYPC